MATKKDPLQLNKKPRNYINCLPCSESKRVTEAIKYCIECKSHLCKQCLHDHNKFASLRKHKVVNKSEVAEHLAETDQAKTSTAIECSSHYGQYIDTFCKDHNEVCCNVCLTIKHRSCKQIETIMEVAKGIKEELRDTKLSLEQYLLIANQGKVDRNKNLINLDEEKTQILSDVDHFEENIIERIRLIAETSRENVRDAHAKHVKKVKSDLKDLETVMSVMSGLKDSLNKPTETDVNEVEAFMSTKKTQVAIAEVKMALDDLSDKWLQTDLHYAFKKDIIQNGIKAFGNVIEEEKKDSTWRFTSKREVNIRIETDTSICRINGICQLIDGTYVTADSGNANIKKLTDNLEVTDFMKFDDSPESICVTGQKEVAVAFPEKNMIQFVTIDEKMSLGTSFSTAPGRCTAINYDSKEEKLYVGCTYVKAYAKPENPGKAFYHIEPENTYGTIFVYNKQGTVLTRFENDRERYTVLFEPHKIFYLEKDEKILVFEKKSYKHPLVFKNVDGQLVYTRLMGSNFSHYRGTFYCLLSTNTMIINTGYKELSLTSTDGWTKKSLPIENLSQVLAAVFNKQRSTLVVAGESNEITEFKVPLKILKLLE